MPTGGKPEQFLPAMGSEEQAYKKPHDTVNGIREASQRVHERRLSGALGDVKILARSSDHPPGF